MKHPVTHVYFIKPVGMDGPVKIGVSQSPDGRRETLATWSPFALEIIAVIRGDAAMERRFHSYFRDTYQRREWFGWSSLMAETVAAINAGTFDVSVLPEPRRLGFLGIQRKPWTDEQRIRASYNHRCRKALWRSGYATPIEPDWRDPSWQERIPEIDQYLADPAKHGRPVNHPWAERIRAET